MKAIIAFVSALLVAGTAAAACPYGASKASTESAEAPLIVPPSAES